jgi:aminoglycoside 3-N-acetyltransferase
MMSEETRPAVTYRELITGFRNLGIERGSPVIAHASLSSLGDVRGGPEALLGALQASVSALIMPAFTSRPAVIPEVGPEGNAIKYGAGKNSNLLAEFFKPEMPADQIMGIVPETLRKLPGASRSSHPLLSFVGLHADTVLASQTLADPLAPIRALVEQAGWVLLIGVDHTVNTSIHYAEKLAGRKQFLRWALTADGVLECPGYPGCSDGFQAIAPRLETVTHQSKIGASIVQAVPLKELVRVVMGYLAEDPLALLCQRTDCERCNAVRQASLKIL